MFKNPIFIFAIVAFWVNQYLEKSLGIVVPVYHSYGDDLMAMPVVFGIGLQLMRWWHPLGEELTFSRNQIIVGLIYISVVFELVLPRFSATYTGDLLDVLCYAFGAFVFQKFMNKPAPQSKKSQVL
jgi:hypothetical protein